MDPVRRPLKNNLMLRSWLGWAAANTSRLPNVEDVATRALKAPLSGATWELLPVGLHPVIDGRLPAFCCYLDNVPCDSCCLLQMSCSQACRQSPFKGDCGFKENRGLVAPLCPIVTQKEAGRDLIKLVPQTFVTGGALQVWGRTFFSHPCDATCCTCFISSRPGI
ncbi:transcriptional-regulating factor 1 [Platysternon megacephalum]|uniref:Transcriptional-regulating factor 1 n=1 Tax=Platysternon megacephalum TaxID=55544 RepID=A0A4D9E0Q3_9SAUR|nr:transcriptional-regulating factor 1 [Platysternon megacephalum]